MKEIPLSGPKGRGLFMLVDDEDYELMSRVRWYPRKDRNGSVSVQGHISAHGFLTGYRLTDHVNGNQLDNTRANLRDATPRQNSWNRGLRSDSRTGYKGVCLIKSRQRYRARIVVDDKRIYVGWFVSAIDAARAYDELARKHYGEFARLNFPDSHDPPVRESLQTRSRRRARNLLSEIEGEPDRARSKYSETSWKRPAQEGSRSGFKGIRLSGKRWQVRIMKDGKRLFLGYYDTPEQAARAYDAAARDLFGEHAWLNFPDEVLPTVQGSLFDDDELAA